MSEPPVRFGILGCGNIAGQFASDAPTAKRSTVVACGSRSSESATAFADRHPQPHGPIRAHGSYDALLADPDVDAIYLTLPNTLHRAWTIRALEAGKHVLCEKPLALNEADAEAMFDAADTHEKLLVEAYMYRAHPLTRAVCDAIRDGRIGDVRFVRASFCYATSRIAGNIRFDPALGGGALWDIGGYCVSFARLLAGLRANDDGNTPATAIEPDAFEVFAHRHDTGVDDYAAGSLRFHGGEILATFTCGMTAQADNLLHVGGTQGFLDIPVPWKPANENSRYILRGQTPPKMDQVERANPKDQRNAPAPGETHVPHDAALYALEADAFADAVRAFEAGSLRPNDPFMPRDDSLGNVRLLEAMQRRIAATA
ncbi:MAG: Gfo/Idh/MocA family oxidoreductase [Planctomycetota bacterium]